MQINKSRIHDLNASFSCLQNSLILILETIAFPDKKKAVDSLRKIYC